MSATTTTATTKIIDRNSLKAKLDQKAKFHLWNVLTKDYYKPDKNIPGSKWISVDELEQKLPSLNAQKEDEIVVYCGGLQCPSSKRAAEKLVRMGFKNVSAYEGGIADWAEGNLPLVSLG